MGSGTAPGTGNLPGAANSSAFDDELLRVLAETSDDAIMTAAPDGTIVSWNRGAERLFGYPAADAIGRTPDFLGPEDPTLDRAELTARAELDAQIEIGSHRGVEFMRHHKDGTSFVLWVTGTAVRDASGAVVGYVTIGKDLTRRRQATADQARLAAIVASSDLAIIAKSLDGTITSWNRGAEGLYEWSADEAIGRHISLIVPGDHLDELRDVMARVVSGERVDQFDTKRVRRDGAVRDVEALVSPIYDADGRVLGVSATARDVTDQRRRERHEAELEIRLGNVQRLESLGRLAGGVAHDFNNLLAVMLSSTEFVREAILGWSAAGAGEPPPLLMKDLSEIQLAAQRGASLTRQLLAFGRRDQLRPESIDLNRVISDLESLLIRTLGSDVRLLLDLAADLPYVLFDTTQLEHLVLNLAVNARDAMPRGGTLMIDTALEPDTDPSHNGGFVRLAVTDTGCGMTPEVKASAFEPFFTTKEQGKGTGLGLATAYGVVTQIGGTIDIMSEVDVGTQVRVRFSCTDLEPETPYTPPAPNLLGHGETVLVAEDVDAMRELVRRLLSRNGYKVITVADGVQALRVIDEDPGAIDLLITDVVMPKLRGDELEQAARAVRADLPMLLMSGFAQALVGDAQPDTDLDILEKPFTEAALLEHVRRVLDGAVAP